MLKDKFEFREIQQDEITQAVRIEQICFPPHEACKEEHMTERIQKVPELFFVAVDKETGKVAGFLNGIATNDEKFRDDFFIDADLNEPTGKHVMLLGLDVLPEYRGQGLAREIVSQYVERERQKGREKLILTCLPKLVEMYIKMGFQDDGISGSTWGNEEWHEMSYLIPKSKYVSKAKALFREGYNCAQSVFLAFEDLYSFDRTTALKLSSSFGGGMGRLREVCGAVSGMFMVAGVLYGYDSPTDHDAKKNHYARIQELAKKFEEANGSIVCRDLLGLGKTKDSPNPDHRTESYYKKRPCAELVEMAAAIMEEYIVKSEKMC